ncbi:MAG: TonB-dependent receptor [Alphaproteobacteria bacterium]|nr:TonB-dependent receptor [Alphaproteobacteria bacterium]
MKRLLLAALLVSTPAWAASVAVDGTLQDETGKPASGKEVKLQNGQGAIVQTTVSDAKGHYAFAAVPTGSYVLLAAQEDHVLGSAQLSVADAPVHKDISLSQSAPMNIVVARRREMRNSLSPTTGTNQYKFDADSIASLPQGADTSLDKVLLQAPGVAEDSLASGGLHIRGEHADLQYRLNGILLPEGISGFGDTLDTHIIERASLLDGALPAQYGYRTAGVVDIDTKTGFQNGGTAEMMGGSNGTLAPSISYGGTAGNTDYFVSASHLSSDLGIENPTPSASAIHDHTEQNKQFGYASYMLNPMQRVEMIAGNSISYFQIPNNPNQATGGYQLNGSTTFDSSALNERQFESNQYLTAAWQGRADNVDIQIAPFIRSSETHFRPDITGDLMFNGVASDVQYKDLATGLQNDNSWKLNAEHTLRAGFSLQNDHIDNNSTSYAFETDGSGNQQFDGAGNNIVTGPITSNHTKDGQLYGLYLQDEWKLSDQVTVNYGARFDQMEQYVSENQLSPRLNIVYKPTNTTTLHAGYARYFTPPPMELVSNSDLAAFANTTNAPSTTLNAPVKPERSHNFDIGASQKIGERWQVDVDAYYKLVHDLLDEGQFGPALILTPFNYEHGYIYGSEISATYTGDKLKAYANFAFSRAMGENVVSAQFNFDDPSELAYIQNHYVHLDHDQTYTLSGGVSYDVLPETTLGLDGNFGSGLRDGFANTSHLRPYAVFNASIEQKLDLFPHDETALRLSVDNIFNSQYELRDGTGIGVGAPQYGARRGVFAAVIQKF